MHDPPRAAAEQIRKPEYTTAQFAILKKTHADEETQLGYIVSVMKSHANAKSLFLLRGPILYMSESGKFKSER